MTTRIGALNQFVTIKRNTATAAANAFGEAAESFTNYMANVSAEVTPLQGAEIVRRGYTVEQAPIQVRIRWTQGKTPVPTDRLVWAGGTYDTTSVVMENGRRRHWVLAAVKVA